MLPRPYKVKNLRNSIAHKLIYFVDGKVNDFTIDKMECSIVIPEIDAHYRIFIKTSTESFEKLPALMLEDIQSQFDYYEAIDDNVSFVCFWITMKEKLTPEEVLQKFVGFLSQI